jgi:hypothetical protein
MEGLIAYHAPIMKAPTFEVNGFKMPAKEVGLLKNNHGVFANVSHLNKHESFAMRVQSGKISVFENIDISVYSKAQLPSQLSPKDEQQLLASGKMDYLMDEVGNVYTTRYRDLKDVYAYSDAAMVHVKRVNRYRWLRGVLASAGGLLTGIGVVQAGYGGGITPALVMGAVGFGCNFLFIPAIDDAKWEALETYNNE